MITLDRSSGQPLADQIEERLRALVESGRLPAGSRLASIRQLAQQLAVSPNTVVVAYDRLVAAGTLESRGTAGFFVCEGNATPAPPEWLEAGDEQEPVWLAQQANDQRAGMLLASSGGLPPSWLAEAVPAAALQRALARHEAGMAARCPPQGLPELRERIALLMRAQGMAVDAGRLLTTWGGTHAIDLVCRAFLQSGDAVLVESPGYFLMMGRLKQAGYRVVPVPRRPDGVDLEALEAACREHRPRVMFVQSVLHNPTGWSSSAANLHRLLGIAQRHGVLLAEDDVQGHFHPGHPTRLAQLSGLEGVIYYSSFCKALSPALRLGYVAAEPTLLKPLLREKIYSVLTTGALNELVLLELLAAGRWRKHLDRLQRKLGAARNTAARLLRESGVLLDHPGEGGLFLWGTVPSPVAVEELVKAAYREKILLVRGSTFMSEPMGDPHLRFNVVFSQHARLGEFLRRQLGAATQMKATLQQAVESSQARR